MNKRKPDYLHIDFETRSRADLREVGTVRYAADKSTHVICAWIHWRKQWHVFDPTRNRKGIRKLMEKAYESGAIIVAYNWAFEYSIMRWCCTRVYDWPEFSPERFECTMARSLRHALPGKLEEDAAFLNTAEKDKEGHALMLRVTKPRRPLKAEHEAGKGDYIYFDLNPEKIRRVSEYCRQDVVAEMELMERIPPLSKRETKIFRSDQMTNARGVTIDTELVDGAIRLHDEYKKFLLSKLPSSVWKHIGSIGSVARVREYCTKRDPSIVLPNMQAATVALALRTCTDDRVRELLTAYTECNGKASAKYTAVKNLAYDGKLYFNLQYCGASSTGRWAGRGVQLQNLARPVVSYDPDAINIISFGEFGELLDYAEGQTIKGTERRATPGDILKSYVRSIIIPSPGYQLAVNDYASVEARKVFWYADDKTGLEVFESGQDPYVWMAARIFEVDESEVTPDQRFVGKQSILGMGYGMGAMRFIEQCADYGQPISQGLAYRSIKTYRTTFHRVQQFWYECENAVKDLINSGDTKKEIVVGRVSYRYDGRNIYCRLPSGTDLTYHLVHMDVDVDRLHYWTTPLRGGKKMLPRSIWGGGFVENICQASSRDLMADAMLRLDAHEHPNILQVHDELVNQVGHPDCMPEVQACITKVPKWAKGFPLEIEGAVVDRYRKI